MEAWRDELGDSNVASSWSKSDHGAQEGSGQHLVLLEYSWRSLKSITDRGSPCLYPHFLTQDGGDFSSWLNAMVTWGGQATDQ